MNEHRRIYLDNAATSWPKPEAVYAAVDDYQRRLGAPAGRSAYEEAMEAGQGVDRTRQALARFLNSAEPRQIVFTSNGTEALNLAIHGLLRPGDHVVTTVVEHNSVLRPLRLLENRGQISVTRVGCDAEGFVSPDEVRRAMRTNTRLVAVAHVSNVTGAVQPIEEIGRLTKSSQALFLVDAAQSLGHLPIDVRALGIDLLAAPGHKGLLGPLGTGLLYIRPGVEQELESLRQGGTGTQSEEDIQPEALPEKYEAGNLNTPGILGLGAGVRYLLDRGWNDLREHETALTERLLSSLQGIVGVRIHGPQHTAGRLGVISCTVEGYEPQEVAIALDAAYRVQVRAGLHCAPQMHRALGTLEQGGAVRFSLGHFTTAEEIDIAADAVRQIAESHSPV